MNAKPLAESGMVVRPSSAPQRLPSGQNGQSVPKRQKSRQRSAVTNGTALLVGVPNTNAWARRCRDILGEHLSDLGGEASSAERSLARRAAVLTTELEMLESQFALDGKADVGKLDIYVRGVGGLRRLLQTIGLERRARDLGPTLSDFLPRAPR